MKKVTIKQLIEFRGKSEKAKKKFAMDIKLNKVEPQAADGGGNYWTIALSAISKAYKLKDLQIIGDKIKEFEEKLPGTKNPGTKAQYNSNIDLLRQYQDFDFKKWTPNHITNTEKNYKLVMPIKELLVESSPQVVYSFGKDELKEVGATWLVAKKNGYKMEEMGMFADILYRYLRSQFGKKFAVNPRYCIAVDLVGNYAINYSQLKNAEVPSLLNKIIEEIKRLM